MTRALKYVPELQQQVEGQLRKKEELLSKLSSQGDLSHQKMQSKNAARRSSSTVSASQLNEREVIVQITTYKVHMCSLSEILLYLFSKKKKKKYCYT